jgi:hypothetical protein
MTTVLQSEGPLYLPTREDSAINRLFENALPCPACRAPQRRLWPLMSAEKQGVFAISCTVCDYIGDDGTSIADAITAWNKDQQRSG